MMMPPINQSINLIDQPIYLSIRSSQPPSPSSFVTINSCVRSPARLSTQPSGTHMCIRLR